MEPASKKHSIFTGRLNRSGFFLANLYWSFVLLAVGAFDAVVIVVAHSRAAASAPLILPAIVTAIVLIAIGVLSIGFMIRRFHDIGQTGLLTLLILAPGAGTVLFIVLLILPGTAGKNPYGDAAQRTLGFRDVSGL